MNSLFLIIGGLLFNYCVCDHFVDPKLLEIPEILRLEEFVANNYLINHSFLRCFENGEFANMTEAAAIFALNHYVYSKNFINYLQTVAAKVENKDVSKPILDNINEELGNYEQEDIDLLTKIGISEEWYNKIPHKYLSQRFFESLGIDAEEIPVITMSNTDVYTTSDSEQHQDCAIYGRKKQRLYHPDDYSQLQEAELFNPDGTDTPGEIFTKYMIHLYKNTNACESLAIIGFAIEETVSKIYEYIWNGLQHHTQLTDDQIVFFPLHILIDDGHADLLKLGFKHYIVNNVSMCQNAEIIIKDVLEKRSKMYDDVRREIEEKQGSQCALPYEHIVTPHERPTRDEMVEVEVEVDAAVIEAQKLTIKYNVLGDARWSLIDKMSLAARILAKQGHGETLSGQITCRYNYRDGNVTMLVNAYGKPLELVSNEDFLEIDGDLNVLKGEGFANKATRFHFHVYNKRPDIKCIVHTHPPYSSALAISGQKLSISHMDTMALYDDVQYLADWPGIPFGDEEGDLISGVLSDKYWSALLAHHGLIVGGTSIEEATYRAYFFEKAARMQINALSAVGGDINKLPKTKAGLSRKARDWRISQGPVDAHFNGWAQIILKQDSPF